MLVKFPDRAFRVREAARRPRRSKNGTPEERAAAQVAPEPETAVRKQRRSKNGTPEQRAARKLSAAIIQIEPRRAIVGSEPTKPQQIISGGEVAS